MAFAHTTPTLPTHDGTSRHGLSVTCIKYGLQIAIMHLSALAHHEMASTISKQMGGESEVNSLNDNCPLNHCNPNHSSLNDDKLYYDTYRSAQASKSSF